MWRLLNRYQLSLKTPPGSWVLPEMKRLTTQLIDFKPSW